MELHTLKPPEGSRKARKRVGRGPGSGSGKTSGRGHKGAGQRSGHKIKRGHEGGQMPLNRRVPKFGFTNIFKKKFQIVNINNLVKKCKPGEVNAEAMKAAGLIKKLDVPVKILGNGEIDRAYFVQAAVFSKTAKEKLEKAGGKAEVVSC